MRLLSLCLLLTINCVFSKTATKSLTESLGQEVIEIGAPLKDLPGELEEEPSAERDDDDSTSVSIQPATKKEVKKTTIDGRRKLKDIDKIDSVNRLQEDDEERVEKELADIYKDSNDYKADSEESTTTTETTTEAEKPILRQKARTNFKFQPDLKNPKEIERFRTSVDEISCDKAVTKKLDSKQADSASSSAANLLLLVFCFSSVFYY